MRQDDSFFRSVCRLAVPVTLQSMLQSSFSIVDQVMIGQLNAAAVAGVGLAGKFSSIYSVVVSAVGGVAGIMIAQYLGQENRREVRRSFRLNLGLCLALAVVFSLLSLLAAQPIMQLYTRDGDTLAQASAYLGILSGIFLPMAGATMLSTLLRCTDRPQLPLYASIASALVNTGGNYLLIFGHAGLPAMGVRGAAMATVLSQWVNFGLMLALLPRRERVLQRGSEEPQAAFRWGQYAAMLLPTLVCEFLWSLGENVYAAIYGHMGTDASAAMTLIHPVVGLLIGALCGLSQAASVITGKLLGQGDNEGAYLASRRLLRYTLGGAVLLSALVIAMRGLYVQIYQVDGHVKALTEQILLAFALVAPFNVLNMVLGNGIIRSGGKTRYVMCIDLFGTWCIGVPVGLLAAFVWKLPVPWVYFLLSLEECVRFAISLVVFQRKKWMNRLQG